MLPRENPDNFNILVFLLFCFHLCSPSSRNCKHIDRVSTDGLSNVSNSHTLIVPCVSELLLQIFRKLGICIWVRRTEIHCIILVSKSVLETQAIVKSVLILSFYPILFVSNFLPLSHPTFPAFLKPLLAECQYFHPIVKQRMLFNKVYNIQFYC